MDLEQIGLVETQCAKVLMQCRRYADQQEFEKAAALFTTDVIFKSGDDEPLVGREANIEAMYANIGKGVFMRCLITNIIVTVADDDHATATSYWLIYRHKRDDVINGKVTAAEPTNYCESEDKFIRTEEGWRIAQRHFKTIL